jgi:Bromodomain
MSSFSVDPSTEDEAWRSWRVLQAAAEGGESLYRYQPVRVVTHAAEEGNEAALGNDARGEMTDSMKEEEVEPNVVVKEEALPEENGDGTSRPNQDIVMAPPEEHSVKLETESIQEEEATNGEEDAIPAAPAATASSAEMLESSVPLDVPMTMASASPQEVATIRTASNEEEESIPREAEDGEEIVPAATTAVDASLPVPDIPILLAAVKGKERSAPEENALDVPSWRSYPVIEADPAARHPRRHRYPLVDAPFSMDVVAERTPPSSSKARGISVAPVAPSTTRDVPNAAARQRGTARFLQRLTERATHDYLPVLLGHAVLEECQQAWYHAVSSRDEASAPAAESATVAATTDGEAIPLTLPVTVSPGQLLQRVQRGRPGRMTRALYDSAASFETTRDDDEEINPYLEPDHATIVQWIQSPKGAKTWTTVDVQAIWTRIAIPCDTTTDPLFLSQLLLHHAKENPRSPLHSLPFLSSSSSARHPLSPVVTLAQFLFPDHGPSTRLVLQYSGNADTVDDDDDLAEWEVAFFGRSPFTVRLELPEHIEAVVRQHVHEQAAQQAAEWHARRQLEADRRHSLASGYWPQPSWLVVAAAQRTVASSHDTLEADPDFALAQRLATQDDGGRRKTSRRTGDQAGIFYGNQSNLTMKQLMDALLRAVSVRPVPTLAGLLQAVPDDSSDPVKRTRTALGRLLYKRHQLARLEVDTTTTDANVWEQLQLGPLWRMPPPGEVASTVSNSELSELVMYLRTLQQMELHLRRLVLAQLTEIPVAIVATAGDDRLGSMESMDDVDFENPSSVAWQTEGHPLLHQRIYRPLALQSDVDETTKCIWFELTGFVPSVASTPSNDTTAVLEKPSIGRAREPTAVERRMRFRAVACDSNGVPVYPHSLILTEAQVHAGRKAAELFNRQFGTNEAGMDHPFASGAVPEISLIPVPETADAKPPILGYVVGHDRSWEDRRVQNKILVLPKQGSSISESFWTTLESPAEGGGMTCMVHGETYTVQQFDFHSSSKAYQECMSIVRFLQRHPKAGVFQEPVDPVALGIPDYPRIIQHPMDVSTVLKKLERGDYSQIPPTFMKTASPATRMLNGPFRSDVERIFDNAMLFNPPQDWIHQAASVVKKAVIKKIEQASSSFLNESRTRKQSSIYVDYDSDVDMYVYESDYDDEKGYSRKRRKRPGTHSNADRGNRSLPSSEDSATRCIERGLRIQKMLSDTLGLRGPLSNLPIVSNASDFSLPSDWLCRYKPATIESDTKTSVDPVVGDDVSLEVLQKSQADLDELLSIHRLSEENEQLGTRRSTRATENSELDRTKNAATMSSFAIEYICTNTKRSTDSLPPINRSQVEMLRERLHETYFAKLYHAYGKDLQLVHDIDDAKDASNVIAQYSSGSFPPFLGRVVPMIPLCQKSEEGEASCVPMQKWEIRESMVLPALRWIIRGLLYSEHLVQIADGSGNPLRESLLSQSENTVVLANHVYFIDDTETPFDVLDIKEMTRRKKQRNAATTEDSEDEVELSEYEKARAERVARNTQRLQALGLA